MSDQLPLFDDDHDADRARRLRLPDGRTRLVLMAGVAAVAVGASLFRPAAEAGLAGASGAGAPMVTSESPMVSGPSVAPLASVPVSSLPPTSDPEPGDASTVVVVDGAETVADGPPVVVVGGDEPGDEQPTTSDATAGAAVSEPPPATCELPMDDGAAPATESGPVADDAIARFGFDEPTGDFLTLAGTWTVVDGEYVQTDPVGFDLIAELITELPDEYVVEVAMRSVDGPHGGGLVLGQPLPGSRRGAHVIDVTAGGTFLRFGAYDETTGQYGYLGGVELSQPLAPGSTAVLEVEVVGERTVATVGDTVAVFGPVGRGHVGLVTSEASMAFDDLVLRERS